MTKIAIYGDSFAADYEGWPKYFGELMKAKVTTFGKKGSSVGYSYLKFLETHEKYDIVYFLWTSFDREWLISPDEVDYELKHYCSFQPSLPDLDPNLPADLETIFKSTWYNPNMPSPSGRIKWHPKQDIEKWIISEHSSYKLFPCKNLINVLAMKDSVKLRRPDCKNIETVDFHIRNKVETPGMIRIELQDMIQFSKSQWLDEIPGKRLNHLTPIQNKEFSSHLYSSFLNNTDIHKTFKDPQKYYTMSKTLEESGFEPI